MSGLRVLVDATMLDGGPSGAATRLAALGAAHAARGRVEVLHLVRPDVAPLPGLDCVPLPAADTPLRRALAGRRLDSLLVAHGARVLQCGALPLPRVRAAPLALTLHDLRFLRADAPALRRLWARAALPRNLARAARVVAVSRSTGDELVARGLLPRERVAVVPNAGTPGVDAPADPARIAELRRRLGLNTRYVLAIGPVASHKRPGALLAALAAARARPGGADLALVLAGRADAGVAAAAARRARSLGLLEALRVPGPLSPDDLLAALSGADALASAGSVEGFSIPVVDAQRLGVPVVAVAAGALPEVVGDGGWLVPPGDAPAFADALLAAVTPGPERDARLAAGSAAAARWSWETSAASLEALWEDLAAGA
jgi:glycosyltransferase involved in cell wall biosynthesis